MTALSGNVIYNGTNIPVFEEFVQETATRKIATFSPGSGVNTAQAYILLLNQTLNDNSPKCNRNDECSIQLQIVTRWQRETGGSRVAEEISEIILPLLDNLVMSSDFNLYRTEVVSIQNVPQYEEVMSYWVTQILVSHSISQL